MVNGPLLVVAIVFLAILWFGFIAPETNGADSNRDGQNASTSINTDAPGANPAAPGEVAVPTVEGAANETFAPSALTPLDESLEVDAAGSAGTGITGSASGDTVGDLEDELSTLSDQVGGGATPEADADTDTPATTDESAEDLAPTPVPTEAPPVASIDSLLVAAGFDTGELVSPNRDCAMASDQRSGSPSHLLLDCPVGSDIDAPAGGHVVGIWSDDQPDSPSSVPTTVAWSWTDIANLGSAVVIDHGPLGDWKNVTSVIAGFGTVDPALQIAGPVVFGDQLGTVEDSALRWQIWADNRPLGTEDSGTRSASSTGDQVAASGLASVGHPVADSSCPLDLVNTEELPNADRSYRNGIHRGVDFVCGATGNSAYAFADGTVVMVKRDYVEPTSANRNAVLANATVAGFTPRWTLNMVYGNFVVIEHGGVAGGETYTISAHLASVDPAIAVGAQVSGGDTIGAIGNTGTGPAAAGVGSTDRSYHLHWELFIDGRWLAQDLGPTETADIYEALLCSGPRPMHGC